MPLRSHEAEAIGAADFFLPGSIVAVAATEPSVNKAWFIEITNINMANDLIRDS